LTKNAKITKKYIDKEFSYGYNTNI